MVSTPISGPDAACRAAPGPVTTQSKSVVTVRDSLFADAVEFHLDYATLLGSVPLSKLGDEKHLSSVAARERVESDILARLALALWDSPNSSLFRNMGPVKKWEVRYEGPASLGVSVLFGNRQPSRKAAGHMTIKVECKGVAFETIGCSHLLEVERVLSEFGFVVRADRLDLAWDGCRFTVDDVWQAWDCGERRSFAKSAKRVVSEVSVSPAEPNVRESTVYIGCKEARPHRLVRVYDYRGYVRCEHQLTRKRAEAAFELVVRAKSDADRELAARGLLVDYVDFLEEDGSLLPWWSEFVDGAARVRVVIPRSERTLRRTIEWFGRSVVRSLTMMVKVMEAKGHDGYKWLVDQVRAREGSLSDYQASVVEAALLTAGRRTVAIGVT